MKVFKRIFAVAFCVLLLTFTAGSDYLDASHMSYVNAAEVVVGAGITAATMFQICLFIGAVAGTCYVAGEVIDNREEIARAGKSFIDSVKEIPEGFISKITDITNGQEYVFGSEAYELIRETPWEVIQGGAPGDNNNGDDKNDKEEGKNNIIDLCKSASQYVGDFFALGSTFVVAHASELYQKWVNGVEMTEAELAAIEPFISGYCNQYDVSAQWSGSSFDYIADIKYSFDSYYSNGSFGMHRDFFLKLHKTFTGPIAAYYCYVVPTNGDLPYYSIRFLQFTGSEVMGIEMPVEISTESRDGAAPVRYPCSSRYEYNFVNASNYKNFLFTYSVNFPVFASLIDAENYLRGRGDVTNALNYAKVYRHADWLSDDWAGQLIDPLTDIGLTLNQLLALMKALGVHALGNSLSPAELIELLRKSLLTVNPDLLPGETPVSIPDPAPGRDPVYYPSPDAHPKPEPEPGPGADPEPGTGIAPDPEMSDYKVELTGLFPFCIPFDFVALLKALSAEPEAPRFALPVSIPAIGYEDTFYIDMSVFDDAAKVMRTFERIGFVVFLMFATSKVIRW